MDRQDTRRYFTQLHDVECNQKYDKDGACVPYSFHLMAVEDNWRRWRHLLHHHDVETAFKICWGHDCYEDARVTYNNIKDIFGERVAEGIFLCSEMRGRNRAERKNDQFYKELVQDRLAVFAKLCDISANMCYGLLTNSDMFQKAKAEYPKIREKLYCLEYDSIFVFLDKLNTF
jgi:(p)ppGpp synthase/HD superfamily hydrolase